MNGVTEQIELDVTITRRNRDVFSDTFTLPAAELKQGPTGSTGISTELAYEPDVLTNLRQYSVDITHEGEPLKIMTHDGKVVETEFRLACEHMLIEYYGPTSWASAPVIVTSAPPERAEGWLEAMDE